MQKLRVAKIKGFTVIIVHQYNTLLEAGYKTPDEQYWKQDQNLIEYNTNSI